MDFVVISPSQSLVKPFQFGTSLQTKPCPPCDGEYHLSICKTVESSGGWLYWSRQLRWEDKLPVGCATSWLGSSTVEGKKGSWAAAFLHPLFSASWLSMKCGQQLQVPAALTLPKMHCTLELWVKRKKNFSSLRSFPQGILSQPQGTLIKTLPYTTDCVGCLLQILLYYRFPVLEASICSANRIF